MSQLADLSTAIGYALRAPSVHNTQPWRWRIRSDTVELHADWHRHLISTDPDRRDLVLSCGAALHHLRVALAAQGLAVDVDRMPDPEDNGHLATVTVRPGPGDPVDAVLVGAIDRRRTDRRRMSDRPVPEELLRELTEQARRTGALLLPVAAAAMGQLLAVLSDAAQRQRFAPGYASELQIWTRRHAAGRDGVAAASVAAPVTGAAGASPLRRFPRGLLDQPPRRPDQSHVDDSADSAVLLVIATHGDSPLDRLRAGEATSAVLLAATRLGLATTPLSQAVEVDTSRHVIQREVLHVPEYPQLIIRVGWPVTGAAELPVTPRRDLHSTLLQARPQPR